MLNNDKNNVVQKRFVQHENIKVLYIINLTLSNIRSKFDKIILTTMGAGAPDGNKNAEKWTLEEAVSFYDKAIELSKECENNVYKYDFLGEIAREMGSYIEIFDYLSEKFPELLKKKNQIKRNCEANCFSNSKKGNIREASAIMNLKSNHGWRDRTDITTNEKPLSITPKEWIE